MAKKDFRLLFAFENRRFQARAIQKLKRIYTVHGARDLKNLSAKLRQRDYSLVVVDQRFSNLRPIELQEMVVRFCPNIVFMVYSHEERKSVSKQLQRYRAMDYILYNARLLDFIEKVHKAVRWTILQAEVRTLSTKVARIAESIKTLSKKIEKAY